MYYSSGMNDSYCHMPCLCSIITKTFLFLNYAQLCHAMCVLYRPHLSGRLVSMSREMVIAGLHNAQMEVLRAGDTFTSYQRYNALTSG